MIAIERLSDCIKEEIRDAEKYARYALDYKIEDKALADTYYGLSNEELQHMDKLHSQVERLIIDYKTKKGDIPEGMKAIYEYLHKEWIENVKEVKILLSMYKG